MSSSKRMVAKRLTNKPLYHYGPGTGRHSDERGRLGESLEPFAHFDPEGERFHCDCVGCAYTAISYKGIIAHLETDHVA